MGGEQQLSPIPHRWTETDMSGKYVEVTHIFHVENAHLTDAVYNPEPEHSKVRNNTS